MDFVLLNFNQTNLIVFQLQKKITKNSIYVYFLHIFQLLRNYNNVQIMMKRVGTIYSRDTSKSKDRVTKLPLKDIDTNAIKSDCKQRQNKRWRLELDNVQDSQQKRPIKDLARSGFENDRRQITFSEARQDDRSSFKECEEDVVKKLACLTKIINHIGSLKACGLKPNQEDKLIEIQDRLLEYQRKLIQNEKLNFL